MVSTAGYQLYVWKRKHILLWEKKNVALIICKIIWEWNEKFRIQKDETINFGKLEWVPQKESQTTLFCCVECNNLTYNTDSSAKLNNKSTNFCQTKLGP